MHSKNFPSRNIKNTGFRRGMEKQKEEWPREIIQLFDNTRTALLKLRAPAMAQQECDALP